MTNEKFLERVNLQIIASELETCVVATCTAKMLDTVPTVLEARVSRGSLDGGPLEEPLSSVIMRAIAKLTALVQELP